MFRKFLYFLPLFLILNSVFTPPAQADWPADCALDYPICHVDLPPGGSLGVCLPRSSVNRCTTLSGVAGNWCCPSVLPTNTPSVPAPTPSTIPSCLTNGNYCVPSGESCNDPSHIRGSGGQCQQHFTCCQYPIPTVPPGGNGNPPPIPLPTYPTNFSPLEYPCDQTTDEEFHPLRPYPGSPCDPLIPKKKEPEFLSFACGKSLNTLGDYRVNRRFTQLELDIMSPDFRNYGEPYHCGAHICIRKRSVFDITLDLSTAKFPILGNTQDPLDDATKVNNYLSWYLTGTNPTWLDDLGLATQVPPVSSQCIGDALTSYMNAVIAGTTDVRQRNIHLTSPAFNLTNPAEQDIFIAMRNSGANFADIDAFAGNTYTLDGVNAFDWVTDPSHRGADGKTWKEKFTDFNKSIIFTEFGDFATFDNPIGSPTRPSIIDTMRLEFNNTAGDIVVKSVNYFNAFGGNPQFIGHRLVDVDTGPPNELYSISSSNLSKVGVNSATGVNRNFIERVARNGATWSVELILSPGDIQGAIESANAAHRAGIRPIFRPCFGNSCAFSDPAVYVDFIHQVSQRVDNQSREIWFIAGPNEPAGEHWAAPQCATVGQPIASIDSFLTYSGPVRKLLPQYSLDAIRFVLARNNKQNVHNYLLDNQGRRLSQIPLDIRSYSPRDIWTKIFQRVPLASMEDTVGEVTIGLITSPRTDGSSPQPPDVFVGDPNSPDAMRLTIKDGSDSRLYFPHIKTVSSLIEVLNAISRPKELNSNSNAYKPDDRNVTQRIDQHQGSGDNAQIQIEWGEGGFPDDVITRNTEIREGKEAPPALFGQTDYFEFDQRCELTTLQNAPGDNLFGQTITGRLAYTHDLKFDPVIIPPNCGGGDLDSCNIDDSNPSLGGTLSRCCPLLATRCENIAQSTGGYDWRCTGGGANEQTIPTEARVAVFTKTPLIDRFYSDLISNTNSFFRRFINWYDHSGGGPDTTIRSGALTFPAKTQVGYQATAPTPPPVNPETVPNNPHAGAGANIGGAEIYFPRLGSLADYFLGNPTNERLNLQKMLRPKYFGTLIGPGSSQVLTACQPYLSNFPGSALVTVQGPHNTFTKAGDSITASTNFMVPFSGNYNLGQHTDLQAALNFFTSTSFSRYSYASCSTKRTEWLLSTPPLCDRNGDGSEDLQALCGNTNSPLRCELDAAPSAVTLIMMGTNDHGLPIDTYKQRVRNIVDYTISRGSIPILSTLPHLLTGTAQDESTRLFSEAIKEISTEKGVPMIDYRKATEDFIGAPTYGIGSDSIHPSVYNTTDAGNLSDIALSEGGYNIRNFVSLCALDAIWKTRLGGGSTTSGNTCSYTNTDAEAAFTQASVKYGVPVSMLRAVHGIESFPYSPTAGKTFECRDNAANAAGPFQIVRKDSDPQNSTYHAVTCDTETTPDSCTQTPGKLSRCNIFDAAELAARVLLSKVNKWEYAQCRDAGNISETNLADIYNSSCRYYGVFTPDSATDARGRDFPSLPSRQDGRPFNYCDVVCGRMKQDNPALSFCPAYPAQQAQ